MIPLIDLSRAQGPTNFSVMRDKGVRGLILRVAHALTLDTMFDTYYPSARGSGFPHESIGVYSFLNPKRGTGFDTGAFAARQSVRVMGRSPKFYMLDIESNKDQGPFIGTSVPVTEDYCRENMAGFWSVCPDTVIIGYGNRSFYNGPFGPNSIALAQDLDWIVARYPVNSVKGYQAHPLPGTDGWEGWAYGIAPEGPFPPIGTDDSAWQFSAGYNGQGPAYGASSTNLDLNLVKPDAWDRWTRVIPNPPEVSDMPAFISNWQTPKYGSAPSPQSGCSIWELVYNPDTLRTTKRKLDFYSWAAYGSPYGVVCSDETLDNIPDATPAARPVVTVPPAQPPVGGWPVTLALNLHDETATGKVG